MDKCKTAALKIGSRHLHDVFEEDVPVTVKVSNIFPADLVAYMS